MTRTAASSMQNYPSRDPAHNAASAFDLVAQCAPDSAAGESCSYFTSAVLRVSSALPATECGDRSYFPSAGLRGYHILPATPCGSSALLSNACGGTTNVGVDIPPTRTVFQGFSGNTCVACLGVRYFALFGRYCPAVYAVVPVRSRPGAG